MLPVLTAFAEGKTIQFRTRSSNPWKTATPDYGLAFSCGPDNYRIKPEAVVRYHVVLIDGVSTMALSACACLTVEEARKYGKGLNSFNGQIFAVHSLDGKITKIEEVEQ